MCACVRITASMLSAGTGSGCQFRSRSSFSPWKSPASTSTRRAPVSRRYLEPVTVRAAPRNVNEGVGMRAIVSSLAPAERFHEPVEELEPLVILLHSDAFVFAVGADVVHVEKRAGDAVGRYASIAEVQPVGCARGHDGNDGNAGPHLRRQALDRAHDLW